MRSACASAEALLIRAPLAGLFSCFDVQVVARAFERAGSDQDALVDEILKVARGRGARSTGDRNVILGAQAALEALHSFAEDPGESFFLPLIEPTLDPVVELRFLDQEDRLTHLLRSSKVAELAITSVLSIFPQ